MQTLLTSHTLCLISTVLLIAGSLPAIGRKWLAFLRDLRAYRDEGAKISGSVRRKEES